MITSITSHFSRKVLFLSFIFLMANLGIYALKNVADQAVVLESLAPKLISETIEEIELKSFYDEDFRPAREGQEIFSGTTIKTSEAEFTELVLGNNVIKLNESTELELVENNFIGASVYLPDVPRLVLNLKSGSIWVNAFDFVEVQSPRSVAHMHHAVGLLTYSAPINRVMVVTGDVDLEMLSDEGEILTEFVVPLHNQVTFIDSQITDAYKSLKPSKIKKELKMTPISAEVLEDEWVAKNAYDFTLKRENFNGDFIYSGLAYNLKSCFQSCMSYISFVPEAKRNLALVKAKTMISYLLGNVQDNRDLVVAKDIIADFKSLVDTRKNDPLFKNLIVETLFSIENAEFGSPAYTLKEVLIDMVEMDEGVYVYRLYLTDIRRMFFEENVQKAESVLNKWSKRWSDEKIKNNIDEFNRQTQILNHTILSHIDLIPISILEIFDDAGTKLISYSLDPEETSFEVIKNRLQIAATLVSHYQYVLAKQYLKNSYLSLNIEEKNTDLASTKIFLENGKLLAQRIQYAEDVLHGASESIDETKFRDYFQARTRDEVFAQDLQNFFDLEEKENIISSVIDVPTPSQVSERFMDVQINVNYGDISLIKDAGFTYKINNARLVDRGVNNETLSFSAIYDYKSNSVSSVVSEGREYVGGFTLPDIIPLLRKGDSLVSDVYYPTISEAGIDLLITDEEKIVALEGQLIAQDIARQLAYNELEAVHVIIPEVKFNIEILDALNLDKFKITNAFVVSADEKDSIIINFNYNSQTRKVTNVTSEEDVQIIEEVDVMNLASEVLLKVHELNKRLEFIDSFNTYMKQNDLNISSYDIIHIKDNNFQLNDLEMLTLGLKVSGIYDFENEIFISVSHKLLSSKSIGLKEYFEQLAELQIADYLADNGISVTVQQIKTTYPFYSINVTKVNNGGYEFDFDLDMKNGMLVNVTHNGVIEKSGKMTFDEFLAIPTLLDAARVKEEE